MTLLGFCPIGCLILAFLNWDSQQGRDIATSGSNIFFSIRPILFLYYEKSLVSSNLNSKLFSFHCVRPYLHTYFKCVIRHSFFHIFKDKVLHTYILCTYSLSCIMNKLFKNRVCSLNKKNQLDDFSFLCFHPAACYLHRWDYLQGLLVTNATFPNHYG